MLAGKANAPQLPSPRWQRRAAGRSRIGGGRIIARSASGSEVGDKALGAGGWALPGGVQTDRRDELNAAALGQ